MRNFVLALGMAALVLLAPCSAAAGDAFDFGDMPPLPPPLLDDSPNPPPLSPPEGGALSPLTLPPSAGSTSGTAASSAPPPSAGSSLTPLPPPPIAPPATTMTGSSLEPPAPPPLTPPPVQDGASGLQLPGEIGAPPSVAATATPAVAETPRQAKISGGRVNVRAGPNTQYESIAVLTTGSPVTVLAKNGEWYKIIYPADQLASVHKNYVDADIAGEIPEAGLPGIVNQDGAEIHAWYWDKSTVVGQLKKGDPVTIKQERGNWYRITAPESARAYVFAQYVKVDGSEAVVADSSPPPPNPAVDMAQSQPGTPGEVRLSANDVEVNKQKLAYFTRLKEQHAREEEEARVSVNRLEKALDDLDSRLRALDEEAGARLSYSVTTTSIGAAAWAPPDPAYGGYTGWVENIGRLGGAPASFRLVKGGEIRFHLRTDQYNLNEFTGRRVWVNGTVSAASGAVAPILNVNQMRILTDMEIAEGMRQQQEASGLVPAPGSQPYIAPTASDPYAVYYDSPAGSPYASANAIPQGGYLQPTPVIPSDSSQLPDVVGGGAQISGSYGEVDSDFYEQPAISEIGP